MAKLQLFPYPGDWTFSADGTESFSDFSVRTENMLGEIEAKSKMASPENPVGFLLSFPIGDGSALYIVTKADPLTIAHVPYCDGYQIHRAHVNGLCMNDILLQMSVEPGEVAGFHRTMFLVEVVSTDCDADAWNMDQLLHQITDGMATGVMSLASHRPVSAKLAAQLAIDQGSSPELFDIDEDGNETE